MNPKLFTSLLFLLSMVTLPAPLAQPDPYTACNSNFTCGNLNSIPYPFWGNPRPEYCGHPDFNDEICCRGPESIEHCIFLCNDARDVWKLLSFGPLLLRLSTCSLPSLIDWVCLNLSSDEVEQFWISAWAIWLNRNGKIFNSTKRDAEGVFLFAQNYLADFKAATTATSTHPTSTPSTSTRLANWTPPNDDFVKLNFDASRFPYCSKGGVGVVACNSLSQIMAAISAPVASNADVDALEAEAALNAILLAEELGFRKIILEGDSLSVINAITSPRMCLAPFGHFIDEIKQRASSFLAFKAVHVKRTGNGVAHNLARFAHCFEARKIWHDPLPPDVLNVMGVVPPL